MAVSSITLHDLNRLIRNTTDEQFPDPFWVIAEILELNVNRSGHCYLELIEKSENGDAIIARSRATIWSYRFGMLKPFFETTTGSALRPGIKVLVKVEVNFHEVYGLSLNISDIDPSYTVGDLAMKRREVIDRLTKAGIMDMNRGLLLPPVPQRIAVISSETAAGYGDFTHTLLRNPYSFRFDVTLFPAVMQGDAAERSIIEALDRIHESTDVFDAVVLIRGGGSQADLQCFNGYDLCFHLAQFPVPVLSGIGHERDESVADLVAHTSLKTPTAVAEFLLDRLLDFSAYIERLGEQFNSLVMGLIREQEHLINEKSHDLKHYASAIVRDHSRTLDALRRDLAKLSRESLNASSERMNRIAEKTGLLVRSGLSTSKQHLHALDESLPKRLRNRLKAHNEQLDSLEKHLELLRPERVIARGYALASADGKIIKTVTGISPGTALTTQVRDGTIESTVTNVKRNK
jgi:exodeoxyribonuclease VII large subunit